MQYFVEIRGLRFADKSGKFLRIYIKKIKKSISLVCPFKSKLEKIQGRVWIRNKLFWTHNLTGVGVSNISAAIIP